LTLLQSNHKATKSLLETPENKKSRAWLLGKHLTWDNKISGIAMGYCAEAMKAFKYLDKKKIVGTGKGDLTTSTKKVDDLGNSLTKVIQLKHTICDTPSKVDEAIKKAFIQLSGKNGEVPSHSDILVAEIFISNPKNPWPLDKGEEKTLKWVTQDCAIDSNTLKAKVRSKLVAYLFARVFTTNYDNAVKKQIECSKNAKKNAEKPIASINKSGKRSGDEDTAGGYEPGVKKKIKAENGSHDPSLGIHAGEDNIKSIPGVSAFSLEELLLETSGDPKLLNQEMTYLKFPALLLKINFTTGRYIKDSGEKFVRARKIVFSIRWTEKFQLEIETVDLRAFDTVAVSR
jgi:hypothetical protein